MDGEPVPPMLDVLVIGAGISGIGFAQTYLTAHPEAQLRIVDRDAQPGGTWNARRLFPTFRSQLGLGMAEFSDMAMRPTAEEQVDHSFVTGSAVTRYLEEYLDRQTHNGASLRTRVHLNYEVKSVDREGDDSSPWLISGRNADGSRTSFRAQKLVVATGTTSEPHFPALPDRDQFQGLVVHQSGFGASPILASDTIQNVTVLGGAKSAADMVYACVKAGKTVTWLIRASGSGPAALMPGEGRGAYRNQPEYNSTRIMSSLSPSPWAPEGTRTKFMGRTVLGRSIMVSPWSNADKAVQAVFDEARENGAPEEFQKLRPRGSVFWANSQLGLVQHPDFWPTVADHVRICRADIASMTAQELVLADGARLACDALVCGTGWEQSYSYFSAERRHALGLPTQITAQTPSEAATWSSLHEDADQALRKKWPAITNPPPYHRKTASLTPFRLYRYIAPLQDPTRSVVFIGQTVNANAFRNAEVQSLWALAYLDRRLRLPSLEHQRREVAEVNVWCRRRYLLNGMAGNTMHHDLIGYADALLDQLSLTAHRAGRTTWQWWSRPNFAADLRGLRDQYLEKFEGRKRPDPELLRQQQSLDWTDGSDSTISLKSSAASSRSSTTRRGSFSSSTFSLGRKPSMGWLRPSFIPAIPRQAVQ